MRVCLPTMGKNGMDERVHNHFGSARYFTIYDTDTQAATVVENNNEHHTHGACQPVDAIASHQINAVLTSGMGGRAVQMFNNSGIKVFQLAGHTVRDAIGKFERGELLELTVQNACAGHSH